MNKKIIYVLIAVLFAGVGTAGGYFYQYNKSQKEIDNLQKEKQNQQKQIEALQKEIEDLKKEKEVLEQTADWETYRNGELGYEVKYPAEFVYEENTEKATTAFFEKQLKDITDHGAMPHISVTVYDNPEELSFDDWLAKNADIFPNLESKERIEGNKGESYSITYKLMPAYVSTCYFILDESRIYAIEVFTIGSDFDLKGVYDQMVSTFKTYQ